MTTSERKKEMIAILQFAIDKIKKEPNIAEKIVEERLVARFSNSVHSIDKKEIVFSWTEFKLIK